MTDTPAFHRLLAKGTRAPDDPRPVETLQGHTNEVMSAAARIVDLCGAESLKAAGLTEQGIDRLRRIVQVAAFIHDLGKCSDHFQAMVRRQRTSPQLIRHDALTLWLCWPGQVLATWIHPAVPDRGDYLWALITAAGHHRKFPSVAVAPADSGAGTAVRLLTGHDDFLKTLDLGQERLHLGAAPLLPPDITVESNRRSRPEEALRRFEDEWEVHKPRTAAEKAFLAVCKALVLSSDVAGSALPRAGVDENWIGPQMARRAGASRLRSVAEGALRGASARPFQQEVASSKAPVTLVTAGCGTGKTLAAYLWASENAAGRQLWFTYPTTGTATEGFRDYVADADIAGRLEHSRAAIDLEILGLDDGLPERDQLDSLRLWGTEVVNSTVDALLGIIQNQRKGLCAWPGIASSAVVFDEVHAYDDRLFGALLRFLAALPGIPVLLMTASLPVARLTRLRETVERAHGTGLHEVPGPTALEELPRYRYLRGAAPEPEVERCLSEGGKVLWVSDTVNRCVSVADKVCRLAPEIYHSRFRYVDRVKRHRAVIESFRREGPAFATTTQVAEMSLDLSADLLVTDLAPIPAVIQRLGRLNRRATVERPIPPRPFIVLPFSGMPYESADLTAATEWLEGFPLRDLSQRDLIDSWVHRVEGREEEVFSRWIDGGFHTEPDALREASPGLTVLLESDAPGVRSGAVAVEEVVIPMPPPPEGIDWMKWPRLKWIPVAPPASIYYDPLRGARWVK